MALQTKNVIFTAEKTDLQGYLAWNEDQDGSRPAVLVFPEWWGLNNYIKKRTEQVASLGYLAMGVDMYGNGKTADHPEEAGSLMNGVLGDLELLKSRVEAAYQSLRNEGLADPNRMGAIGYCFGGAIVLHMARIGMDLDAVASFHGNLSPKAEAKEGQVKARILVCHGEADSFIPADQVEAFQREMNDAGADYRFESYPGAVHGFTNPGATALGQKFEINLAYQEEADRKSWASLEALLKEVFGK